MWLCFNDGFLSVVADKNDPTRLLVRSRRKQDLLNVCGNNVEVIEGGGTDYRWRTFIDRKTFSALVAGRIETNRLSEFQGLGERPRSAQAKRRVAAGIGSSGTPTGGNLVRLRGAYSARNCVAVNQGLYGTFHQPPQFNQTERSTRRLRSMSSLDSNAPPHFRHSGHVGVWLQERPGVFQIVLSGHLVSLDPQKNGKANLID
jgi:hypothetical protein